MYMRIQSKTYYIFAIFGIYDVKCILLNISINYNNCGCLFVGLSCLSETHADQGKIACSFWEKNSNINTTII